MQNKKILQILIVLVGIVCLYELSFTFFANSYEAEATEEGRSKDEANKWIKEHATDELWMGLSYLEVKKREINLGLDLRGGISVTLEIAVNELVRSLAASDATTPKFKEVEKAAFELKKKQPGAYLDLFKQAYDSKMNGVPMAKWFAGQQGLTVQSTDDEVMAKLKDASDGAIGQAREVLRTRVKQFGVAQPDIKMVGNSGRIIVELPGVNDIKRVRGLLQGSANLEIWDTWYLKDFPSQAINTEVKLMLAAQEVKDTTLNDVVLETVEDTARAEFLKEYPFTGLFVSPSQYGEGCIVGSAFEKDTSKIMTYIRLAQSKRILRDKIVPAWSTESTVEGDAGIFTLYLLKAERGGKAFMSGEFITSAKSDIQQGRDIVSLDFRAAESIKWAEITGKSAKQNGKPIAIVLDDVVHSAPGASNKIEGGNTQITSGGGENTGQWARDLANVLNAGKFPAPAKIVQQTVVGPTLGKAAISAATWSFALALLLVLIYMIFYYSTAGIVANVALLANMFLIVGVLAAFPTISLTLPGIAGIVLTIGMSVDANVLIYERIREELKLGKTLKNAIDDGYKHAYTAILDANVTTLITGIILWYFGTSVIESFAQTLVAGIFTSLFSAIFITRIIFDTMLNKGKEIKFSSKTTESWFANAAYNVISSRKKFYVISGLVIIAGIVSFNSRGFDEGIDFSGGRTYTVGFNEAIDVTKVKEKLNGVFVADGKEYPPEVKTAGEGNKMLMISTKFLADDEGKDADAKVEAFLFAGLSDFLPSDVTEANFTDLDESKTYGVLQIDTVQSTIADDIIDASYKAVLIALIAIFLYVAVRFRKWEFGVGALIAIFHDVLIVLAIFSIAHGLLPFSLEINSSFVAAILTVVGYSINDTVVVFDRIRERLLVNSSDALKVVVNKALNSTLSRTFNTSMTLVVVLLAIMIFGTGSLQGFAFALLVGVVVGTYSSICIATPIYVDLSKEIDKKV